MSMVLIALITAWTAASLSSNCRGDEVMACEWREQHLAARNLTTHRLAELGDGGAPLGAAASSAAWSRRLSSTLRRGAAASAPWPHSWARCTACSYSRGEVTLYDPYGALESDGEALPPHGTLRLASSKWHGFFYHSGLSDEVRGHVVRTPLRVARSDCTRFVEERTIVFSLLTWQVGHLLLDVLEPLFYAAAAEEEAAVARGAPRRDVRLFFDVANAGEMSALHQHVLDHVFERGGGANTPYTLLRRFTRHAIHSRVGLDALPGATCFRDLQLGLDIEGTYGHFAQRAFIEGAAPFDASGALERRYRAFRRALLAPLPLQPPPPLRSGATGTVAFVMRREAAGTQAMTSRFPRSVLNVEALIATATAATTRTKAPSAVVRAVLGDLSFSEQLALFAGADVLVGAHGTGMHNVLFMRPGAAVIVFEQPGWCRWRWRFTTQATLLGVHSFVFCDDTAATRSVAFRSRHRWSARAWADGPTTTKDASILVDVAAFGALLDAALSAVRLGDGSGADGGGPPAREHCVLRRGDEARCELASQEPAEEPAAARAAPPARESGGAGRSFPARAFLMLDSVAPVAKGASTAAGWTARLIPQVVAHACDASDDAACAAAVAHLRLCIAIVRTASAAEWERARAAPLCLPMDQLNAYHTIDVAVPRVDASAASSSALGGSGGDAVAAAWLEEEADAIERDGAESSGGRRVWRQRANSEVRRSFLSFVLLFFCLLIHSYVCSILLKTLLAIDAGSEGGGVTLASRIALFDSALTRERVRAWPPIAALALVVGDEVRILSARLDIASALQHRTGAFCTRHALEKSACVVLTAKMHARARAEMRALALALPPTQAMPSAAQPFVFLHHEKCAGSTLRRYIVAAAKRWGSRFVVPGHNGVADMTFDLSSLAPEEAAPIAVLAGHFQWGVWDALPLLSAAAATTAATTASAGAAAPLPVACFVMLREPVSRTISFYYERIFPVTQLTLSEIAPAQLNGLMATFYGSAFSKYRDEGLEESACKMLSGANWHKGKTPEEVVALRAEALGRGSTLPGCVRSVASRRLAQCVVGLQDDWTNTQRVLRHWYPWLVFSDDKWMNTGRGDRAEKPNQLRAESLDVIERHNVVDLELYAQAAAAFTQQLVVLDQ